MYCSYHDVITRIAVAFDSEAKERHEKYFGASNKEVYKKWKFLALWIPPIG